MSLSDFAIQPLKGLVLHHLPTIPLSNKLAAQEGDGQSRSLRGTGRAGMHAGQSRVDIILHDAQGPQKLGRPGPTAAKVLKPHEN